MAQWQRAQRLSGSYGQCLRELYGQHFSIEARHYFAEWIEDQAWSDIDPDESQNAIRAKKLLDTFIALLQAKIAQMQGDFLLRHHLEGVDTQLQLRYNHCPLEFVRTIRHCLATEENLLRSEEASASDCASTSAESVPCHDQRHETIDQAVQRMSAIVDDIESEVKQLQQKQESIVIQTQGLWRVQTALANLIQVAAAGTNGNNTANKQQVKMLTEHQHAVEKTLLEEADLIVRTRKALYEKMDDVVTSCGTVQSLVLDEELLQWQRKQQLSRAGGPSPGSSDRLKNWCQELAHISWTCQHLVQTLKHLKSNVPVTQEPDLKLQEVGNKCEQLMCQLIARSFIVDQQPPAIVKTNTRFAASVRLLAGGKLSLHLNHTEVTVEIMSERQARQLAMGSGSPQHFNQTIMNNKRIMEYHKGAGAMVAEFNNMQLPGRPRRSHHRGSPEHQQGQIVAEEKFCLLFTSKIVMGSGEVTYTIQTISLPLAIIVHNNQIQAAEAMLMWDNNFAELGRLPFAVPEAVLWSQMAQALSARFKAIAGRGLEPHHLSVIFKVAFPFLEEDPNVMFSWGKFVRDNLPEQKFTFWDWFYGISELIRKEKQLQEFWKAGYIWGFTTRKQADEILLSERCGTFILRFSHHKPGGLAVAYTVIDKNTGQMKVCHLQPWLSKNFDIRSLADCVNDLRGELCTLYPNVPMDDVFAHYYTQKAQNDDSPYTTTDISVVVLDRRDFSAPSSASYPSTPSGVASPALSVFSSSTGSPSNGTPGTPTSQAAFSGLQTSTLQMTGLPLSPGEPTASIEDLLEMYASARTF